MAKYRKIDARIWNDEKFNSLSDSAKLLFFFLLTHPYLTALGAMRATMGGLSNELGWTEKAFREAFGEAFRKGMVKACEKACFLWVTNFLKYNKPESPNVVKSWDKWLDYLPECSLKDELIQHVKKLTEGLGEAFAEALPEAFREPSRNHEHEHEHEHDINIMSSCAQTTQPVDNSGAAHLDVTPSSLDKSCSSSKELREAARRLIKFLNQKANRKFRCTPTNLKFIMNRLRSGATEVQCRQIILKKCAQWCLDDKMHFYLRPETLFNATKFESYIGELVLPEEKK